VRGSALSCRRRWHPISVLDRIVVFICIFADLADAQADYDHGNAGTRNAAGKIDRPRNLSGNREGKQPDQAAGDHQRAHGEDEIVEAVKKKLDDVEIEIPFPYRTLTFKEP